VHKQPSLENTFVVQNNKKSNKSFYLEIRIEYATDKMLVSVAAYVGLKLRKPILFDRVPITFAPV
jgi:hypothetical protein